MQQAPDELPRARTEGLLSEQVGDETVIYDLESKNVHCLRPLAAGVLAHCDGKTTIGAIVHNVGSDLDETVGEDEVLTALAVLRERRLLESAPLLSKNMRGDGLSRRDVLHRTAMLGAGAAAASLITTVAAPSPAAAETLQPPGGPCTQNKNCLSNHCCQSHRDCNALKCVACDNACNFLVPITQTCPPFCSNAAPDECCRCVEPPEPNDCKH